MMFSVGRLKTPLTSEEFPLQQKISYLFLVVLFLLKELFLLLEDLLLHFAHLYLMTLLRHMCVYPVGFRKRVWSSRK